MTIARGEWVWPSEETNSVHWATVHDDDELVGATLRESKGSRRIVEKLLVRDPRKRVRIIDLWEDEWMKGIDLQKNEHRGKDSMSHLQRSSGTLPSILQNKSADRYGSSVTARLGWQTGLRWTRSTLTMNTTKVEFCLCFVLWN